MQTSSGYCFHAFLRDITERRAVERAKDEFVSIVSHELRTPLTSIRGSLGLLAGGVLSTSPEKAERMLQIALENTERLVRLINDILDIERMESDQLDMHEQPCDGTELIDRAILGLAPIAAEAQINLTVAGSAMALSADPDRVHQTLTNLISNAVKFSPAGSSVRVSCRREGDEAIFEVSDAGRGIPADRLESIFGRFQQVDASDSREKGGTGLGLAICRKIVEHHGGRIWVRSELGVGSTFSFALPAPVPAASCPAPHAPDDGGVSVLICDDDPAILAVAGAALQRRGYRVILAASGEAAVERALAEHPDVILLDLLLPGMSGWETLKCLREREQTAAIPVMIVSVKPSAGTLPEGAVGWIEKPTDDAALIEAVERAVGTRDRGFRVVVVEDDSGLAEVMSAIFSRHGVESFTATDGRQAIELCQRMSPDLLVLDIGLPDVDGFEVVDWLRRHERLRSLPVVVYTARDLDDADRERLMLGSISQFLTKGQISPDEFERRVMTLLAPTKPTPLICEAAP